MTSSKTILNKTDIGRIVTRMAYEILEKHKGTESLALIGIQTRGVYLAKRIQGIIYQAENVQLPTGDVDITLYRDDWTRISPNPVVQKTDIAFSLDDKQIILVDDVLFTGRTVRAAMDALMDFGRPDRIELAALVDRGFRELPIQADYVGRFVKTNRRETVTVLLQEHDDKELVKIEQEAHGNQAT
jgi:pyrimidine operon attenuation protein/uracil phosphoribosyltransferase